MSEKNFVNYHVLISHSPSCLNRDDMNMQKSAVFGGTRRVRISSQSLKRTIRQSDYYRDNLGSPSVRTRDIAKLVEEFIGELKDQFEPDLVKKTINLIAGMGDEKPKKGKKTQGNDKENEAGDEAAPAKVKEVSVAPWSVNEVAEICKIVKESDGADEKALKKEIEKRAEALGKALGGAVDIALSGRMATSGLMTSIDASLALAHVITTHAVDADIDWFTAVDDLTIDAGETGAGHLNTQEFGAGVFYRYASLNIKQLSDNMGATRQDALKVAAHLAHMLATVVPSAKQNSFAAHNPADFVLASFSDIPLSAANAFEEPVKRSSNGGGFLVPSIKKIEDYWNAVHKGYGLNDNFQCFSLWPTGITPKSDNLETLKNWIRNDGKE